MDINLLDCIAHGTTYEDFLCSFDSPHEAAAHLRKFFVDQLEEAGEDIPGDDELDDAEQGAVRTFEKIVDGWLKKGGRGE